jgi:hypothetical protein
VLSHVRFWLRPPRSVGSPAARSGYGPRARSVPPRGCRSELRSCRLDLAGRFLRVWEFRFVGLLFVVFAGGVGCVLGVDESGAHVLYSHRLIVFFRVANSVASAVLPLVL